MSHSAEPLISVVQLDGLVLLKIINHCKESIPDVVNGQLLGLDSPPVLEITSCFPLPPNLSSAQTEAYQLDMMKMLRTVNVDTNTVGWYQSTYLGAFFDSALVDAQYHYQKLLRNSIVLVYDPFQTNKSKQLCVSAYRLTEKFMQHYDKHRMHQDVFTAHHIESSHIFQQIPLKIHNSHLIHGFLYEIREQKSLVNQQLSLNNSFTAQTLLAGPTGLPTPQQQQAQTQPMHTPHHDSTHDRWSLSHSHYLDSHLSTISTCIDDYAQEQSQYQYYQRTVARQKQAQLHFLNKLMQDHEIKVMQGKEQFSKEEEAQLTHLLNLLNTHKDNNTQIVLVPTGSSSAHAASPSTVVAHVNLDIIVKNPLFKPIPKLNRLDNYLLCQQIGHYVDQVNNTVKQTLTKMILVESMHKPDVQNGSA